MKVNFISILALLSFFHGILAVKRELFKTCDQNGFCHRNRHYANEISKHQSATAATYQSRYSIDPQSLQFLDSKSVIKGNIAKKLPNGSSVTLPFIFNVLENDNIRLRIDEEERSNLKTMAAPSKRLKTQRFNEAWKYAFKGKPSKSSNAKLTQTIKTNDAGEQYLSVIYGNQGEYEARIGLAPFKVTVYYQGNPEVILNDRNFLNVEHWRSEEKQAENLAPEESDFNAFSDNFKDSSNDKLPFGPESVGVDVTFNNYDKVYGIPEHADTFSLKDTTNDDPYRLYNVDIFEYETQSKFPMYGSIPFLVAHKKSLTAGFFWVNSADTYIDIKKESIKNAINAAAAEDQVVLSNQGNKSTKTHWFSENGIIDLIIILDKTPLEVNRKYGAISGNVQLPQLFALGYHQCRWNYNDVDDVLDVTANFDKHEIPYDVIWLDVDYTEHKKYFTWKKGLFDQHVEMNKKLDETGRKLVALIDPHLKTGYKVSDEIISRKIAIQNSDNEDAFKGHCWPGESVWIDTFNPKSQVYWDELFANNTDFSGDETNLHIWNDMNEPSIFSGPETSAPKDLIHYGQWEHRSLHNAYSLTVHEATYQSLTKRYVNKRPFILTRAYYPGSQRSAAMWTGDNQSKWEFLKISIPMVLTSQVTGMPFAGADVGGFFGDPSPELLTRWYQTGIWYPFFRAHAHIDSKRREPYISGDPYTSLMRNAIKLRYSLLPVFYTSFYHSSQNNAPVLTPLLYSHPQNEESFEIEDQFFLGNSGILVKPVTDEGANSVQLYIPDNKPYFDYDTFDLMEGQGYHEVAANLSKIPIFLQGGHIFARKDRYRRSAKLTKYDPYTIVVVLDEAGKAKGSLYIDDGETFNYEQQQEFAYVEFDFSPKGASDDAKDKLSAQVTIERQTPFIELLNKVKVEKIVIVGSGVGGAELANAQVSQNGETWNAEVGAFAKNAIVIRNPAVIINKPWAIELN